MAKAKKTKKTGSAKKSSSAMKPSRSKPKVCEFC